MNEQGRGQVVIVAELSTNHGGDLELAEQMIVEAAKAGASIVKTQHYLPGKINRTDPQRAWLEQSHLSQDAHERLRVVAQAAGVTYMSTPFCAESLKELRTVGLTHFKVASSESANDWWLPLQDGERWFISHPWGRMTNAFIWDHISNLTAIPLYPTPPECVGLAPLLDGWSDHCVGLSACEYAIARGAKVVEVHFKIEGKGRNCAWDKSADDLRRLRAFADDCETMTSGVATRFRTRWSA